MDIKDLDKKQLILLTLLITFVVSIATGIVTVSLMNQMPKSVPQTINNVIQRTIEKVTTVETPVKESTTPTKTQQPESILGSGDVVVSIYPINAKALPVSTSSAVVGTNVTGSTINNSTNIKELGQGIIISDVGLILVDSTILNDSLIYRVILNKIDFDATILKKFNNGFTVLKITEKTSAVTTPVSLKTTN
jgi:hypothetical protein